MRRLRGLLFALKHLPRRRARDRDLDEEIRFHLDAETVDGLAAGLTAEQAARPARRDLGNIAMVKEDVRQAWTLRFLERLSQDVRYAIRVLRHRPVFAISGLLSLALGIGANAALFSIADNLILKPLPVSRPDELVKLVDGSETVTYATYDRLRREAGSLAAVAVVTISRLPAEIDRGGEKRRAFVQMTSDNYFEILGVAPFRGSLFHDRFDTAPSLNTAVISYDYWMAAYSGDLSALGDRVRFGRREFAIIGVAAKGFLGVTLDRPTDVWVRFEQVVPPDDESRTRGRWVNVLGRLQSDRSPPAADAEASALLGRSVQWLRAGTGLSTLRGTLSRPLLLLGLVVALVLLITCANLANLALAGAAARSRELAVRTAIGASRRRIVRQLTTESIVLSLAGAGLALIVAPWTSAALLAFLPPADAPALRTLGFAFDLRVFAFVAIISVLTTVLFGLLPAVGATRARMAYVLKTTPGAGRPTATWTSRGLVVFEVVLCTLLVIVAGVFLRTVHNLRGQDAGYLEDRLLVAEVQPPFAYPEPRRDALIEELRRQVERLPGVEAAAFSHIGQLSGSGLEYGVALPGEALPRTAAERDVFEQRVSPGFLRAMGTRFIAGRDVADEDDERARPVAVVNEAFVRRIFKGADPIGRVFVRELAGRDDLVETLVIGVVRDSKWINLRNDAPAMYYIPYRQKGGFPVVRLAIRTREDASLLGGQVVQLAHSLDPGMTLTNVVPFREIVNRTMVIERLVAHVSTAFAVLGLLIAGIGLYGLLAYAVVRRRREIGIRIAVGARPATVAWMMLRESLALVVAGLVLGVPAALIVTQLTASLLFGLSPGDPGVIAVATGTLALVTLAATWGPARRAASTDPIQALRED